MKITFKKTDKLKIISFCVVFIAYLIEAPLHGLSVIPFLAFSYIPYILMDTLIYAAFFICMLIGVKPFINRLNVLSAFGATLVFAAVDYIILLLSFSIEAALIGQILRPAVMVCIFLLAFRLITKCKIIICKPVIIIGSVVFAAGIVLNIWNYFYTLYMNSIFEEMGNDFYSYMQMLDTDSLQKNNLVTLCVYIQLFLTSLITVNSIGNIAENGEEAVVTAEAVKTDGI